MSSSPLASGCAKDDYATFATAVDERHVGRPSGSTPGTASLASRLLFRFANPMLQTGNARQLDMDDLWELEGDNRSAVAFARFSVAFEHDYHSIVRAIASTFGHRLLLCGLAAATTTACGLFAPVVLHHVIDAFTAPEVDAADLSAWLAAFFASRLLIAFVSTQMSFALEMVALRMVAALKTILFRKAMRRSLQSRHDATAGEIANLYTSDMTGIMMAAYEVNNLWILPVQISVVVVMLYRVISWAAFAGLAVIGVSMAIAYFITKVLGSAYRDMMQRKDERIKVVMEVFGAIQVVKLNAWERELQDKILQLRGLELKQVAKYVYAMSASVFVMWASPLFVSVVSFAVYTIVMGETLTAAKVFTAIALFNSLRDPLRALPSVIQQCIRAKVSIDRMSDYLGLPEVDQTNVTRASTPTADGVAISIDHGTFGWSNDAPVLTDVSLKVKQGDLVVVHGAVGAGKSSLCAALLGELVKTEGDVFVAGSVAYYAQQPWIQNMSIRDNILFGNAFDPRRYRAVLDACGLLPDLKQFPGGDATEIGHKGVNLSGGQKARVSLARACYSDADVFVLDSPLAAVDAVVQSEIFSKCICHLLKDKTVVLVTHNPDIIASGAVNVNVLVENGSLSMLTSRRDATQPRSSFAKLSSRSEQEPGRDKALIDDLEASRADERLVEDEDRQFGRVSFDVFTRYFNTLGGVKVCVFLCLIQVTWQGFQIASDLWLSHWTGQKATVFEREQALYNVGIYALLSGCCALMVLARVLTVPAFGLRGARSMFEAMTRALLSAPLRFFDTNPIGRITNRYGDDVTSIDTELPFSCTSFLAGFFFTVCQLATAVYIVRVLGLFVLPLAYMYITVANFYLLPSREIARLLKVAASPVLSHVSQSEDGVATIRAFGRDAVDRVVAENLKRNDVNNRVWFAETVCSQWFQVRMQLLGCAVVTCVVSALVYLRSVLSPGLVGVAFTYSLSVDSLLARLVDIWAWLEIEMVSPERILDYASIPPEGHTNLLAVEPSADWPNQGRIEFDKVMFSYKQGGAPVLKGLSFSIQSREKVGIVGRTGAGKSSLTMALFRINELVSGQVRIDGVDTSTMPLHTLRSRLSIIPQSPVLFKGTLRAYMDPFNEFSDAEIWDALDKVGMKQQVGDLDSKLLYEVKENGENFSAGERQTLCMARALLTKSRIVVMDEATASIDQATEKKLQLTIRRDLRDATVLTIAHRLETVLDSDRIMVLHDGQVVEFAAPRELVKDPDGVFYRLAKEGGCLDRLLQRQA